MNISNLIVLTLIYAATLLMVQRTERKRRWIVALIAIIPIGYMTYQWGILKEQQNIVLIAAGAALALNVLFWLFWGRKHPVGSSDSIKVIGMED